jgi:predicted dienelactone hydrolase
MKALLVTVGITLCANLAAQSFSAGHASIVLRDSQRSNRKVPVEIFYPAGSGVNGSDTIKSGNERFPVICFAHGYLLSGTSYAHIRDMLVPEGFIIAFISSRDGLFPSHRAFAEDLRFVSEAIGSLGKDISSPLYGIIDTLRCLMGHSMGGGSMFLAARQNGKIQAAVALAPYDTRPSAIEAASGTVVPTLIFSGTNDCITPPAKYPLPIYNSSASIDKTYILIKGGTHCQMGVSYDKCIIGEKMARCAPGMSEQEQLMVIARYLVPWLRFFLKHETEQGTCFDDCLQSDNAITWLQSRPLSAAAAKTE